MSWVNTALNEDTLAAMPAMKAATRPVTATPRTPGGRYMLMSAGIVLVYVGPPGLPRSGISSTAAMPGSTTTNGISALGYAATIGVIRAAFWSLADIARCTSAKLVVQ